MLLAALAMVAAGQTFDCRVASVHDGDTMRCADGTRVRLQGIDANELNGSCHISCARLSASAARDRLSGLALGNPAQCLSTGKSYRRVTAWCAVAGSNGSAIDLSCAQVAAGAAVIWRRFDPNHRLDRCTPGLPPPMIVP
jgi:endonuclease YncB( thermonuclease family)